MPMRSYREKIGEMMSNWGSDFSYGRGPGSVGAVASYFFDDRRYPDRDVVERALDEVEKDIPLAERGAHGWTRADARELRAIRRGLEFFLEEDYD